MWLDIERVKSMTKLGGQSWPEVPGKWHDGKCAFYIDAWNSAKISPFGKLAHMPRVAIDSHES